MGLTEKIGIVVSTKMQKTIVVIVENKFRHPRYAKTIIKTKRYLVHDEDNAAKLGAYASFWTFMALIVAAAAASWAAALGGRHRDG